MRAAQVSGRWLTDVDWGFRQMAEDQDGLHVIEKAHGPFYSWYWRLLLEMVKWSQALFLVP